MIRYRARWVLPIAVPPIRDGTVEVSRGRIVNVAHDASASSTAAEPVDEVDLGNVALLPAFVNAHTHLELSSLRDRVPPAASLPQWVRRLMAERRTVEPEAARAALLTALEELRAWGTSAVGDVTNTGIGDEVLASSSLDAVVFHELIGFAVEDGQAAVEQVVRSWPVGREPEGRLRRMIAAHAPYSVSPALFEGIATWLLANPARLTTVHLAESPDEMVFLATGDGEWRRLLEDLGVWRDAWQAPACDPLSYLDRMDLLTARTLIVHGVQLDRAALDRVAAVGATLVCCPRSNRWTAVGKPPLEAAHAARTRVAFGTDSLASAPDLGVPGELAEARRVAPHVAARWLLECGTLAGARALGIDDLGALRPGDRAKLLAVALPGEMADVEEYLVSGIERRQIAWVAPQADTDGPS